MISPETGLIPPGSHEIQENKANGYGYWVFLPTPAAPLEETLPELKNYGDFTEMPEIIEQLSLNRSVMVSGAPGSGKSHLVRELQMAGIANSLPTFCLTMHINSGQASGISNIKPELDEFAEKARETGGGLVILDNLDVVGYRGKRRTRTRTTRYAQEAQAMIEELLQNPDLVVLATTHDEAWRKGRWTWDDPEIDEPAQATLEAFQTKFEFEGKMALVGLANILRARNLARQSGEPQISIGQAAQVIRMLHKSGRANFFHANHLPVDLFLRDPSLAIDQIEGGRQERRNRA